MAGASGDAGVEYRRGVAGYAVSCGLAGVSLAGIEIPPSDARVKSVSLETDDPVDDIRIDFESGWRAFVQAKRALNAGKPLKESVEQWVHAARAGLDPTRDRLVIVAGTLSGPMKDLQRVLNRERTDHPGARTGAESRVLSNVRGLLGTLSEAERALVLRCAVIWELWVEEPEEPGSQQAIQYLRSVVVDGEHDGARRAWAALVRTSGRVARLRGGYELAGWLDEMRGDGIEVRSTGPTPAAALEAQRLVRERYFQRMTREGMQLELRGLGAELPKIELQDADAGIKVGLNPDEQWEEYELIWTFLRRGRAVLTGLPGGGKSTALKKLAAQLASAASLPFPVFASLSEINSADSNLSFRDRLIAVAVRECRSADRASLIREIENRLDRDEGIALILDSLDETYGERAKVVSEIAELVADLPEGVCILLATRDVAYGQAATLGWPSMRLLPPSTAERTVTAVLEASARKTVDEKDRAAWVAERETWVRSALGHDELLHETPLIPVLLALLAVRRSPQSLPNQRATILKAVVEDIVADREIHRGNGTTLGPLKGTALRTASMQAFTAEATVILNSRGRVDRQSAVEAIAVALAEPWGLPAGQAETAGVEAVRLFDETGIFVISGADETVAPRIALFAEIGDALRIAASPEQVTEWVEKRIEGRQFEPLVLACTLSTTVTRAVGEALEASPSDNGLANVLVQAFRDGAELDDATVRMVCECLIAHVCEGTPEAWLSWKDLLRLPIPAELRGSAVAAASHSPEHELVARASLVLCLDSADSYRDHSQLLADLLDLRTLPQQSLPDGGMPYDIGPWFTDDTLIRTREQAAEALLGHVPGAAGLVLAVAGADDTPDGLRTSLLRLLDEKGFTDEAQAIRISMAQAIERTVFGWLSGYDNTVYAHFLSLLAQCHPHAELSAAQAARLDALADFVTTLGMNDGAVNRLHKQPDDVLEQVIELTVALYGFDSAVLAAQAQLVLERMNRWNSTDPYFALFDNATARSESDWSAVSDPASAVIVLLRLFALGFRQARFAAIALWRAPVAELAAPLLRSFLPKLVPMPRNHEFMAATLASLASGPEPQCWVRSDEPALRKVAALLIAPLTEGVLCDQIRELLNDPDGHVQEAAIKNVNAARPPDLDAILADVVSRPAPGWTCSNCRTVNNASESRSCSKDGCSVRGPNPAMLARKYLLAHQP